MATIEVKQLRDFLREEQEPLSSETHLKESGRKNMKGILHLSKVKKVLYNHFISVTAWLRSNTSNHREGELNVTEKGSNNRHAAEIDRLSSGSSTTVFNSCSNSDLEETSTSTSTQKESLSSKANTSQSFQLHDSIDEEATTEREYQGSYEEESELSPVSVLEHLPCQAGSPYPNYQNEEFKMPKEENPSKTGIIFPKKVTDDSILAPSLWKMLFDSTSDKPIHLEVEGRQSNQSSQYLKSKMILQQTKQLLFDCVREAVDSQAMKERQQQQHTVYLRSAELGMLIVQRMKSWGKQSEDEGNTTKLLHLDLLNSTEEWTDYDMQRMEIGLKIGDAVLEGTVNESIIQMTELITNC